MAGSWIGPRADVEEKCNFKEMLRSRFENEDIGKTFFQNVNKLLSVS
jgi:hypothetical protein